MLVGHGEPIDIIEWFRRSSEAHLLGLFFAGDSKFDKFLDDVLTKSAAIDVTSGHRIDLILFGSGAKIEIKWSDKQSSAVVAKPITPLREKMGRIRSNDTNIGEVCPIIQHISDIETAKPAVRKSIKKSTTLATHKLVKLLKLKAADLPGLVLISRSSQKHLVLRTRGVADAEFLIQFLIAVNGALEHLDATQNLEESIKRSDVLAAESALAKIQAEREVIERNERRLEHCAKELSEALLLGGIPLSEGKIRACLSKSKPAEAVENLLEEIGADSRDSARRLLNGSAEKQQLLTADRAKIACTNAQKRIQNFEAVIPSQEILKEYLNLQERTIEEIQETIKAFERKIGYKLGVGRIISFLGISAEVLGKAKRLISLAVAIKTGGAHLIK